MVYVVDRELSPFIARTKSVNVRGGSGSLRDRCGLMYRQPNKSAYTAESIIQRRLEELGRSPAMGSFVGGLGVESVACLRSSVRRPRS